MIRPDGIEVYLKPHGPENEDVKFAEYSPRDLDTFEAEAEERNKRCVILAEEGAFDVVIRCLPYFNIYSASAISIMIREGGPYIGPSRLVVVQRSLIFDQKVIKAKWYGRNRDPEYVRKPLVMADASRGNESLETKLMAH